MPALQDGPTAIATVGKAEGIQVDAGKVDALPSSVLSTRGECPLGCPRGYSPPSTPHRISPMGNTPPLGGEYPPGDPEGKVDAFGVVCLDD